MRSPCIAAIFSPPPSPPPALLPALKLRCYASSPARAATGSPSSNHKSGNRLKPPSDEVLLGTDSHGRDVFARTISGARISLLVGLTVALFAVAIGLGIGLASGYYRRVDAVVMRLMDGIMAIPAILLAIALVSVMGSSVRVVIIA